MDVKVLLIGIVVGVAVAGVGLGYLSMSPSVNADKVCADRFGENWTGNQIATDKQNMSVTLNCTNGTNNETIGVSASVEVDA